MKNIKPTSPVGDIVSAYPKTAALFTSLRIDYCCGGDRPLQAVLQEKHLSESFVWSEISAIIQRSHAAADENPAELSPGELTAWIEDRHHAFLRSHLPETGRLLFTVLQAHSQNHPELFTVHKLFNQLRTELEQHLIKEEVQLFPAPDEQDQLITELRREHEAAGAVLQDMRFAAGDYIVPGDACPTYAAAYHALTDLEKDLFQHIHLENNVLFPQMRNTAAGNG